MCVYEQNQSIHLTYYLQGLVMGTISGLQPFSMKAVLIAFLQKHFGCEDLKEGREKNDEDTVCLLLLRVGGFLI